MHCKALTIAGFDGSGGAGIQADLKTFSAFGCYGMTVLTALPIQNTMGVRNCYELPLSAINEQLESIFEDISPTVIKIGMLFNSSIIEVVSKFLIAHAASIPIVVDPVMMAKSGDALLLPEAEDALKTKIIPISTLITPNIPEAEVLSKLKITCREEMFSAAKAILALGPEAVLLKGGHLEGEFSYDLLIDRDENQEWFEAKRIVTNNTHGTGCTLSAAIAAGLALGLDVFSACRLAKQYLTKALMSADELKVGHGHGPVHHFYHLWPSVGKI